MVHLRDHFTCVSVEDYKQEFLSLDWLYIYTLNKDIVDDSFIQISSDKGTKYKKYVQ